MTIAPEIPLVRRTEPEPAVREYFGVLGRRRRAIAGFVVLVTAVAVGSSLVQAERYTAEARVLIQPRDSAEALDTGGAPLVVDRKRIIDTEVRVISSDGVRDRVEAIFGPNTPAVTVSPDEGTDLVTIAVSSTDPALARSVANVTAREYAAFRRDTRRSDLEGAVASLQDEMASLTDEVDRLQGQMETASATRRVTLKAQQDSALARYAQLEQQSDSLALSSSLSTGDSNLIDPASLPASPTSPQPLRALILALFASSILGIGLAFLIDLLDDQVESKEDVERILPGRPILGLVPVSDTWSAAEGIHVAALEDSGGSMAETFRALHTSVRFLASERGLKTIQVTSALPGEGKSTTAANLAVMFAMAGSRTILVDADLRQPRIHKFFDLANVEGLSTGLLDQPRSGKLLVPVPSVPGLTVLPAGPMPSFPAELLQSERLGVVLQRLAARADVVIIDSPPVLPLADPLVLAGKVDAVLLVASAGGTTRRQLGRAVELLDQVGAGPFGTVLNKVPASEVAAYGSYAYGTTSRRSRLERFTRPAHA